VSLGDGSDAPSLGMTWMGDACRSPRLPPMIPQPEVLWKRWNSLGVMNVHKWPKWSPREKRSN